MAPCQPAHIVSWLSLGRTLKADLFYDKSVACPFVGVSTLLGNDPLWPLGWYRVQMHPSSSSGMACEGCEPISHDW